MGVNNRQAMTSDRLERREIGSRCTQQTVNTWEKHEGEKVAVQWELIGCREEEGVANLNCTLCMSIRSWLHWSQNRHNTTVWTDSSQGSRYQPHYCLCQRLPWNRCDWKVISQQRPTVWLQHGEFVSCRQSGQIPAAVCIELSVFAMDKSI